MRISAKVDYAVRALCELAAHPGETLLKAEEIARAQEIPLSFLDNILVRPPPGRVRPLPARPGRRLPDGDGGVGHHGRRCDPGRGGAAPGGRPGRAAGVARVPRVGVGAAGRLARDAGGLRHVLERVTIADIVGDEIPSEVRALLDDPDALIPH